MTGRGADRFTVASVDQATAQVRSSAAESVLLLLPPDLDPLHAATLRAALGPLAIERAPGRVNALVALAGTDPAAVEAAALFLEGARSTTGQLLEVGP